MASTLQGYEMDSLPIGPNGSSRLYYGQLTADAGGSSLAQGFNFVPKVAFALQSDAADKALVCAISGSTVTFTSPTASKVYYVLVIGKNE